MLSFFFCHWFSINPKFFRSWVWSEVSVSNWVLPDMWIYIFLLNLLKISFMSWKQWKPSDSREYTMCFMWSIFFLFNIWPEVILFFLDQKFSVVILLSSSIIFFYKRWLILLFVGLKFYARVLNLSVKCFLIYLYWLMYVLRVVVISSVLYI